MRKLEDSLRKEDRVVWSVSMIMFVLLMSACWNWYQFYSDNNITLPQIMHNMANVKELFIENRKLKKCLADGGYFQKAALPCKIDGKNTLCFSTPDDYWLYAKFQELCMKD
ncbi:MAG: hypothetical protein WC823_02130 [Parcubacteria group bacterium]|jgi:hypothetical protein